MKKILIVETNVTRYAKTKEPTGLWLGEAAEFIAEVKKAGFEVDYVSPLGGFVPLDPRSMKYVDKEIMEVYEDPTFVQKGLVNTLSPEEIDPKEYIAIYYTGGHGVMWDFPDNKPLQEIASVIYEQGGYVTSVCHGVAGLLNIKDQTGDYLIKGKKITGFTTTEEILARKKSVVPFFNEQEVKKRGGLFQKKRFYKSYALQDERVITGQNPFSVKAVAKLLLKAINQ